MNKKRRIAIWIGAVGGFAGVLVMAAGFNGAVCELAQGDWVPIRGGVGVLNGCGFQKTIDGGKPCWQSRDCSVSCVTKVHGGAPSLPGMCRTHKVIFLRTEQGVPVEDYKFDEEGRWIPF